MIGLAIAAVAVWFVLHRFEGQPPFVETPDQIILGQSPQSIQIRLQDEESGIRSASIRLLHGAGSVSLLEEAYPGDLLQGGLKSSKDRTLSLDLESSSGLAPDGQATLVLQIRDWSWRDGFAGNRTEISIPVLIDTRPPTIDIESGITYVRRGGSGAAVYRIEEADTLDGVRVGASFFPGYPHPSGEPSQRVSIFAVPVQTQDASNIEVVAWDLAGNEGVARFPAKILNRAFRESSISIDKNFIQRVAFPLAQEAGLGDSDPAETFRQVNEKLRSLNEVQIRESVVESGQSAPLWEGAFKQLRGSKVTSRFAEDRSYTLNGETISKARHYGFDLASTARAPITASAAGVVAYASPLGIYGDCVIIDHGLGVASLYGHLSSLDVKVGEFVEAGQILGRSGSTGLAGGDHLHFAILVGNEYVDPLEWWDPKWLRSHIDVRLEN